MLKNRPGWRTDPSSRHALRYWDGEAWTDRVAAESVDAENLERLTQPGSRLRGHAVDIARSAVLVASIVGVLWLMLREPHDPRSEATYAPVSIVIATSDGTTYEFFPDFEHVEPTDFWSDRAQSPPGEARLISSAPKPGVRYGMVVDVDEPERVVDDISVVASTTYRGVDAPRLWYPNVPLGCNSGGSNTFERPDGFMIEVRGFQCYPTSDLEQSDGVASPSVDEDFVDAAVEALNNTSLTITVSFRTDDGGCSAMYLPDGETVGVNSGPDVTCSVGFPLERG